jgi:hypothetical protein
VRLSVDAAVEFGRFKLSGDAAWLPYVAMYGWDTHWLRIGGNLGDFTSAVPDDGRAGATSSKPSCSIGSPRR